MHLAEGDRPPEAASGVWNDEDQGDALAVFEFQTESVCAVGPDVSDEGHRAPGVCRGSGAGIESVQNSRRWRVLSQSRISRQQDHLAVR